MSLPRSWLVISMGALVIILTVSAYLLMAGSPPGEGDLNRSSSGEENKTNDTEPFTPNETPEDEYAEQREHMVQSQIRKREVRDPAVLEAMTSVPRHLFVPSYQVPHAYEDRPLTIGYGQTISQPYIVAVMTEALQLKTGASKALEIGTGSGYQAAVLSEICDEVYTIEIVEALANSSSATLQALGYTNVHVRNADGYFGWDEHAPYDAIIVTCAASHIPPYLVQQLADGGKLILPLGSPHTWQTLTVVEKHGDDTTVKYMFLVAFVPMTGEIEKR